MSTPIEYRVWWIPQVPLRGEDPFYVDVPDLLIGRLVVNSLAEYDLYQYENKIKPDYSNAGGLQFRHPTLTGNEWEELDLDDGDEVAYHIQQTAAMA